eukprot:CAMPEP_0181495526 /NCGR_PEP_ID=MMETSP1110-20121109/52432_1 /TAXON_ID=174948 /ORGANISM="Symbiodinium sp., Strain CCMP421" /LENGTH=67 /DNA_ID=CAMNT_0023623171 /DNA_START=28 /DNA_END=228 /DNA_ORIENTATION=-
MERSCPEGEDWSFSCRGVSIPRARLPRVATCSTHRDLSIDTAWRVRFLGCSEAKLRNSASNTLEPSG